MIPPKTEASSVSPAQTLVDGHVPQKLSSARRYTLLIVFCFAQFLDAFNNSSLFEALPALIEDLGMTESESTWVISAFQLTFAAFLLISGRISDVYNPKHAFIGGVFSLGVLSIGAGFVRSKIPLIVLRALSGISAALTIPSALTLLVNIFTEPAEQARAIGMFGGCGAIGIVLGLIIGAMFIQWASWPWVFYFVAIVCIPMAGVSVFLIPPQEPRLGEALGQRKSARWKSLDLVGVSILTAALILFIFAVTSGTTSGWSSAGVLAPLIISVFGVAAFFWYETRLPADRAAVPPRTWFLPNFSVLFGAALLPFLWWTAVFTISSTLWQTVFHWSPIITAVHMIPVGAASFAISFTGGLSRIVNSKWLILGGMTMVMVGTTLLALADSPSKYWPFVFPGFLIGSAGCMLTYSHTNIAIFRTSPASMAGTVGAIFNGALQLGSAVGISAVGSIQTGVETKHGGPSSYSGREASFWFLLALFGVGWISVLVFYRIDKVGVAEEREREKEKAGVVTGGAEDEEAGMENVVTVAQAGKTREEEPAEDTQGVQQRSRELGSSVHVPVSGLQSEPDGSRGDEQV